jgi:hypothetical protein
VPDPGEALARALHERYVRDRVAAGERRGSTPALTAWEELPDEYRKSSRRNANDLRRALRERGYELARHDAAAVLGPDDVEAVAQLLHERWVEERVAGEWSSGARRDDERRVHPDLVPWSELPEKRRQIDRDLVRSLPEALREVGWTLQFQGIDDSDR